MKPVAVFDSLSITNHLQDTLGAVSFAEMCLYGYFACWLYTYRTGNPDYWDYRFTASGTGAPFSRDLSIATEHLLRVGHLVDTAGRMSISERGQEELHVLSEWSTVRTRTEYIEAACSTSLVLPSGVLRGAMSTDADIFAARNLGSSREMFSEEALTQMNIDFKTIRQSLGKLEEDLLAALAIWATYMSERVLANFSSFDYDRS